MQEITKQQTIKVLRCFKCEGLVAMSEHLFQRFVDHGGTFYCAFGHGQHFTKPEVTRLREQLDAANARAERIEREKKSALDERNAARANVSRLKNRAAAGLCPCCNRTFATLSRHMKTKHPEYRAS